MKKFIIAGILMAGPALGQEVNLKEMLEGQYRVVNRDCLGSGNLWGSIVDIGVVGADVILRAEGPRPLEIEMHEGKREFIDTDGNQVVYSGIAFGNGFGYGETVKRGRFYVSQVEYQFHWELGELHLKKWERIDSRRKNVTYCDLKPVR